jgi:uncharacterized repeat protein (TIGR04076 family)
LGIEIYLLFGACGLALILTVAVKMAEYNVEIEVKRIEGTGICPAHHKIGDIFKVTGPEKVEGLCGWAYHALLPFMTVLRFGGEFPWEENMDVAVVCCPDPNNSVIFEIRRTPK